MDVEQFIVACALDERAAQRLRSAPIEVQAMVIAEGVLNPGGGSQFYGEVRNPSAIVASRIKKAIAQMGDQPWNPNGRGGITGKVKLWNVEKGWGFISMEDGTEIFCHFTDIGGRTLVKGGTVTFDLGTTDQGQPKAVNVSGDVGPRMPRKMEGHGGDEWRDWQQSPGSMPTGLIGSPVIPNGMPVAQTALPEMQTPCDPWNPTGGGGNIGTVKMWSAEKGFGFIINIQTQEEIFCHHSDIGGRSLIKGGTVTYDVGQNTNGKPKAVNISGDVGPRINSGKGVNVPQDFAMKLALEPGCKVRAGGLQKALELNAQIGTMVRIDDGGERALVEFGEPHGERMLKLGNLTVVAPAPGGQQPGAGRGGMGTAPYGAADPLAAAGTRTTCAEVHVTVPQGHLAGEKVRFTLGGYAYDVDVPASKVGNAGQKFVVNL